MRTSSSTKTKLTATTSRHRIVEKERDSRLHGHNQEEYENRFMSLQEQITSSSRRDYNNQNGPSFRQKYLGPSLLFIGSMSLFTYMLFKFGLIDIPNEQDRGTSIALLVIGFISFLPGAYATVILIQVSRGVTGWNYSMLPD